MKLDFTEVHTTCYHPEPEVEEDESSDESMSEAESERVVPESFTDSGVFTESSDDEFGQDSGLPIPKTAYGPFRIYFDIKIGDTFAGRLIIRLSREFAQCRSHIDKLSQGLMGTIGRMTMNYAGTRIHRMVDGMYVEGGYLHPHVPEQHRRSIYRELPVDRPQYYDSYMMIVNKNISDNFGGGRFIFTTTNNVKHCTDDQVPVGCIVDGMKVIDRITQVPTDEFGYFTQTVKISSSGALYSEETKPIKQYNKSGWNSDRFLWRLYNRSPKANVTNMAKKGHKTDKQSEEAPQNLEDNEAESFDMPAEDQPSTSGNPPRFQTDPSFN